VVSGGSKTLDTGISSKPTTETSCGTRMPRARSAAIAPSASRSLCAKIAVSLGTDPRSRSAARRPLSKPQSTHGSTRLRSAGNRDDETLDTALEHEPEIGALVVLRAFLDATDDEEVAALSRLGLGAGHRLGEEVVADVGRDHTQGVGTAG